MASPDAARADARVGPLTRALRPHLVRLAQCLSDPAELAVARECFGDPGLDGAGLAAAVPAALHCARQAVRLRARDGGGRAQGQAEVAAQLPLPTASLGRWLPRLQALCRGDAAQREAFESIAALVAGAELGRELGLHLYDLGLKCVAPDVARAHGVYYTPLPLARHMVCRLDSALEAVGLGGLHGACATGQVVDPAAGTGVFLCELVERLHAHPRGAGLEYLGRLRGHELMGLPRALCRQYLALTLMDLGVAAERADEVVLSADSFPEVVAAGGPDGAPVCAVVGNPPYRRGGAGDEARRQLLRPYREGLQGERNLQPLADDYIAFLRAAELCLSRVPRAVCCMVTNHAFLRGRLHRQMRASLLRSFTRLEVLDLHGSVRVRVAGGQRDENVFSIGQGVCISTLGRSPEPHAGGTYAELRGLRDDKLARLASGGLPACEPVASEPPLYPLAPCEDVPPEYAGFLELTALFDFHAVAGKPGEDRTLVGFAVGEVLHALRARRAELAAGADDVGETHRERHSEAARKLAARPAHAPFDAQRVRPYAYRPFDRRHVYDEPALWTRPPRKLRAAMADGPVLLTTRIVKDSAFAHVLAVDALPDVIALSATSSVNAYGFPQRSLRAAALPLSLSPAQAFGYIYAVLHSPSYRARYLGALRNDFPRIPVARDAGLAHALAAAGQALLDTHLSAVPVGLPPGTPSPRFVDGGDRHLRRVGEPGKRLLTAVDGATRLHVNASSYFEHISPACFGFRVGGYQVAHKWLDDRRRAGRVLSAGDERAYLDVLARIETTMALQTTIEAHIAAAGGMPGAFR